MRNGDPDLAAKLLWGLGGVGGTGPGHQLCEGCEPPGCPGASPPLPTSLCFSKAPTVCSPLSSQEGCGTAGAMPAPTYIPAPFSCPAGRAARLGRTQGPRGSLCFLLSPRSRGSGPRQAGWVKAGDDVPAFPTVGTRALASGGGHAEGRTQLRGCPRVDRRGGPGPYLCPACLRPGSEAWPDSKAGGASVPHWCPVSRAVHPTPP